MSDQKLKEAAPDAAQPSTQSIPERSASQSNLCPSTKLLQPSLSTGDFKTNNRLVIRGDVTNSVITIKSFASSTASLGQTHVDRSELTG
jgi:hypothetical protein